VTVGDVAVFLGNGDGTFAPATTVSDIENPSIVAVGDFNGDGLDDIAASETFTLGGASTLIDVLITELGGQSATATVNGISPVGTGQHQVDASYSGDSNYDGSVSNTIPLIAEPVLTTMTFIASPATINYGQTVTLTATVAPTTAQDHTETGTVTFTSGGSIVGTATIANGAATFATTLLPEGTYKLTAAYSGDDNFDPSTASVTETVNPLATTTTLSATPNPAGTGQPVTLTAGVTGGGATPTATIAFFDGATQIAQGILDATGHASYTTSTLTLGTHNLTAVYAGSVIYAGSTSPVVTEIIELPGFTMTLSSPSISLQTYRHTTTTVTLTSLGDFTDNISVTCGNAPAYVTCTFTPNPAALAGNGTTAVSFYLDTDSIPGDASGPLKGSLTPHAGLVLALSPFGLLVALGTGRRRRTSARLLLLAILSIPAAVALTSCAANQIVPIPSTAPGTYTIPITAAGAATGLTHTAQLTLIVTP
jgi:hypothetical protein